MQPSDKSNNSQPENLQARNDGISDAHKELLFKWVADVKRDIHASYIGHHHMLAYSAIAENESIGRVRFNLQQSLAMDGLRQNDNVIPVGGPYHGNASDASDTNAARTVTDTSVSEQVRSSPSRTENAAPVRLRSLAEIYDSCDASQVKVQSPGSETNED